MASKQERRDSASRRGAVVVTDIRFTAFGYPAVALPLDLPIALRLAPHFLHRRFDVAAKALIFPRVTVMLRPYPSQVM